MSNILYNPPRKKRSAKPRGETMILPRGIYDMTIEDDVMFFAEKNRFVAKKIKGSEVSMKTATPLAVQENKMVAFQPDSNRYSFHTLTEEETSWQMATLILLGDNAPTRPRVCHLDSQVIYLLCENNILYQNRAPKINDQYSGWERIETGLKEIKAVSGKNGILLWQRSNALLIKDKIWKKLEKPFAEDIKNFITLPAIHYLDAKRQLRDEKGLVICDKVLDLASNGDAVAALSRDTIVVKENDSEILKEKNKGYDKVFFFDNHLLLLHRKSGHALLLYYSGC
jgi:hypothetical protein